MTELINDLKLILTQSDSDLVIKFENKLEEIYLTNDSAIISELVKVMDDTFEFDELMFSIIHTIESFEDNVYVKEIISSTPYFILKSPRWASIVYMRIINSPETLKSYINEVKKTSNENKEIIKILLTSMANRGDVIKMKVDDLLNIIETSNIGPKDS